MFLERKGQTLSVLELREVMRHICAFNDMSRFSFIEYLIWTYQKTVSLLCTHSSVEVKVATYMFTGVTLMS